MKQNVSLKSTIRQPLRTIFFVLLLGLISFAFIGKAVGFVLVQRETEVLGSYYRSIGILENIKAPQSGDISAGIKLIETSPYFAYGDQREVVSGVMHDTYNANDKFKWTNSTLFTESFPQENFPNVHSTDAFFCGELIQNEPVQDNNKETIGYSLKFNIDTVLAAYPENARRGQSIRLLFMFEDHETAIPIIDKMEIGQRYFIRAWEDPFQLDFLYTSPLQIIPLDDGQLWYQPLAKNEQIDFSTPEMDSIKNKIDILNENLRTLNIIATADMSAMPKMQEVSRYYYLTAGRWLNRQDDLAGNKVIVVTEDFAAMRGFRLGDEIQLTFRPLKDSYYGYIRDGIDSLLWRSYPTYQDTFTIVGIYAHTTDSSLYAYIPTSSLRPGFASSMQDQFTWENDYSFVLHSSRDETRFTQTYKSLLEGLGVRLTFLENNGPAYWAAVDPIRRSSSAEVLVFGLLMVVALVMVIFLYMMQRKRDYAILRALGVPKKQANRQLILPLLLFGGLGIVLGGLPSWNYAGDLAKANLSTIPTPAGVYPSADLSPLFLAGLILAIFLLLAAFSRLGVLVLSRRSVFELLQDQTNRSAGRENQAKTRAISPPIPSVSSSLVSTVDTDPSTPQAIAANQVRHAFLRKYTPSSLSRYVLRHGLRSRLKSILTLVIALGFVTTLGWFQQTMDRSRKEIDHLYDTTVIDADILKTNSTTSSTDGKDFISREIIDSVLTSGFVNKSILEAESTWVEIETIDSKDKFPGKFAVYAYDSPEAFSSGLADPDSLIFASGWDIDRFAQPRTLEEIRESGLPAIFPARLLAQSQVNVGETIRITDRLERTYTCVIVGQYSGWIGSSVYSTYTPIGENYVLIPLSNLESTERDFTKFRIAHFVLDPTKNRELPQFSVSMENAMKVYGSKFRFFIWDEELRIVIAQLEKNLSLLKVLYPVVMAVSTLIGAGLCFLLLLQKTKEAAIMRVLGTTRTAVRLALISEPLCLSIIGVIIGLMISYILWMASGLVPTGPLVASAGLYLAGALVGMVTSAILVTNKQPIELLQVKE